MGPDPSGLRGVVEAVFVKIYGVQFIHHHSEKIQRTMLVTQKVKKGIKTISANPKPEKTGKANDMPRS